MCQPCIAAAAARNEGTFTAYSRGIPKAVTPSEDCPITKEIVKMWQKAVICVKAKGELSKINMTTRTANSVLGLIQSALNYPDNYCYYEAELRDFQNNNLPLILEYVQECLN